MRACAGESRTSNNPWHIPSWWSWWLYWAQRLILQSLCCQKYSYSNSGFVQEWASLQMLSPGILKQKRKKRCASFCNDKTLKICIKVMKIVDNIGNLSCLGTKKVNQRMWESKMCLFKKCWISVATELSVVTQIPCAVQCSAALIASSLAMWQPQGTAVLQSYSHGNLQHSCWGRTGSGSLGKYWRTLPHCHGWKLPAWAVSKELILV